jgi:uncharacterized protein
MGFDRDEPISNDSRNPLFADVLASRLSRRRLLAGGLVAAGAALLGSTRRPAAAQERLLGFAGVPISTVDAVTVPPGYTAEALYAWRDPISTGPAFKGDASNSVEDQLAQAGMHHDGLHFFPLPAGGSSSTHGLLAVNHEYTDDGLLHPGGMEPWTPDKVRKSQAVHGISVVEVRREGSRWGLVRVASAASRPCG